MVLNFILTNVYSQDIRYRNSNEVVSEIYTASDISNCDVKIPADLLHQDIDLFVKTIEDIGVNPYINLPKESFYKNIDSLKNKINHPLSRRDFLVQFIPIVNELRLSHTHIFTVFEKRVYDKQGGKYLPLEIRIEKHQLYIAGNYSKTDLPLNAEILSINQVPSKEIIENLQRYADGATEYARRMDTEESFSSLLWLVYNFAGSFQIKTPKGAYAVSGMSLKEINEVKQKNHKVQPKNQFEFCTIDSSTGKLMISDFMIKDEAKYYHFLDSVFAQIKAKAIRNLIIDVRDNPGGGDEYGIGLARYLYDQPFKAYSKFYYKKSKLLENFSYLFLYPKDRTNPKMQQEANCNGPCEAEHEYGTYYECENKVYYPKADSLRFSGNVYVLSNYIVYSAGNTFVGLVKDYKIGKIIGSETGQSPSNDGQLCWFLLPHSNFLASGSTTLAIRPSGDPSTIRGVIPDYEITQLKKDTEKGVDTVMDFTFNLLREKKN